MGAEASTAAVKVGTVGLAAPAQPTKWDDTPAPISLPTSPNYSPCTSAALTRWRPVDVPLGEVADAPYASSAFGESLPLGTPFGPDSVQLGDQMINLRNVRDGGDEEPEEERPRRRISVSDAPVGENDLVQYKNSVHQKDAATMEGILKLFSESTMLEGFSHIKEESMTDIANALYKKEFDMGDNIILQGDEGDCLYLIEQGTVDVWVAREDINGRKLDGEADDGELVATLGPGCVFGELALLYNCPRAATVRVSSEEASVWTMDLIDFKMLIIQGREALYKQYEGWLTRVEILKPLNHYELSRLSEALTVHNFREGTIIMNQGDVGDRFFILAEGKVGAYIDGEDGEKEVKVYESEGDYFGEVALLQDTKRLATVRCLKDSVVMSISGRQFERLLGPSHEKLQAIAGSYLNYEEFPAASK